MLHKDCRAVSAVLKTSQ